jgi:uncharacterized membrane protein YphA (DoxX/SURF4 family)
MISIATPHSGASAWTSTFTGRKWALAALWVALAVQIVWMTGLVFPEPGDGELGAFDVVVVVICGSLALTSARVPWLATVARLWIAVMLLGSVADRFGLLGEPGAAGVSWGTWSSFVDYTREVTTFLPGSPAPTLAVAATVTELVLGAGLLAGFRISWMALFTTALLTTYGIAMSISLGLESPFPYNVWVLGAASLVLVWSDSSRFSVDRRLSRSAPTV